LLVIIEKVIGYFLTNIQKILGTLPYFCLPKNAFLKLLDFMCRLPEMANLSIDTLEFSNLKVFLKTVFRL